MRSATCLALIVSSACGYDPLPPISTVAVTVTTASLHVAGWPVYFQNADSSLVAATETDDNGIASAEMDPGGFVTTIFPMNPAIYTFSQVKPGDQLRIDMDGPLRGPLVEFDLTLSRDPANGTGTYDVHSSCGDVGTPGGDPGPTVTTHAIFFGCSGAADLLITDYASDTELRNEMYKPAVAVANNVPVTVTGSYAPVPTTTYSYQSLPAFGTIYLDIEIATTRGSIWRPMNAIFIDASQPSYSTTVPTVPDGIYITNTHYDDGSGNWKGVVDWGPYTANYTLDYAGAMLRPLAPGSPVNDPGSNAVLWAESPDGIEPNIVVASRYISRMGSTPESWGWSVAAPASVDGRVVFPTLPADVFDYNPEPNDFVFPVVNRLLVPGDYDELRPRVFNFFGNARAAVSGPNGRILY